MSLDRQQRRSNGHKNTAGSKVARADDWQQKEVAAEMQLQRLEHSVPADTEGQYDEWLIITT